MIDNVGEPQYNSPVVIDTLNIASFLDPRFKDHYLQDKEGTLLSDKGECLVATPDVNDTESENSQSTAASPSATEETNTRTVTPPAKRLKGLAAVLQIISNEEGAANIHGLL